MSIFLFLSESVSPWILLGSVFIGFCGYLVSQIQNLNKICSQNEQLLKIVMENQKKVKETMNTEMVKNPIQNSAKESESDSSTECQIPHFEDSGEEEEEQVTVEFRRTDSLGTGGSSGYNTEQEVDYDWECYKILRAPLGPVPQDQVLLCFTCKITGFYLKAIVDKDHSAIWIMTYEPINEQEWDWIETTCQSCIQRVRDVLTDGGCPTPFAMDLEETIRKKEESEGEEAESEAEEERIEKPIATFSTEGFIITEPEYMYDSDAVLIM